MRLTTRSRASSAKRGESNVTLNVIWGLKRLSQGRRLGGEIA
jgi:hypothetical protein